MSATIYVFYQVADGEIITSRYGDKATPPPAGAGEAILDIGTSAGLPTAKTHRVNPGPPPTLVARTQSDMDAERNAERRESLRQTIATTEAARDQYAAHGWSTAEIDQRIADLLAAHNTIP